MNWSDESITRRQALNSGGRLLGLSALGLLVPSSLSLAGPAAKTEFNVLKYGARGDGKTLDTVAIQRAIDAAAAKGRGSRVVVPGKRKYLVGTLQLRSNIDFHLADDAELVISTDPKHYKNGAVILAEGAQNLHLSGTGKLNGRALDFMDHYEKENEWWIPKEWRPKMFILTECRGLEIRDITFAEAPEWGLHMLGCEQVLVDNLKVRNHLDVPNCDGIDPDHCRDVEIKNCHIVCGDDAVVVKATRQAKDYGPSARIVVKDCVLETQDSGVKIGTETTSDVHDVRFENCEIKTSCRGLTIQLRDSGNVRDILFKDIKFVSRYHSDPWWGRGEAISFTAIPRTPETKVGQISNIRVENVTGRAENSIRVQGMPNSRVQNVTLKNVEVTFDRWTKYKGGLFDNRPTKVIADIEKHGTPGISLRHADNITLEDCRVKWGKNVPDYFTHAVEAVNVKGLNLRDFEGKAAYPERLEAVVQA
ncbi:glycoside hydrolase family 28 protein [Tellurirhabdus rosea]|uniref:glycoside hydrolase family 28 protein n=1 Tax=Tellurirhabdus rosea TaxID=2674997 RepID=UPI00225648B9|nr:glycosyl hydrolase family 28 protein [Tellurirhabdus rosea]